MSTIQRKLIRKAKDRYKQIFRCKGCTTWADSFTVQGDKIYFWFNTADRSTRVVYDLLRR